MPAKFSAYLTIYNDWEFLEQVLRSIAPYIDELVVVDGAFEWMAPYLTAMGQNPHKSDPRVYDIVAASGIPYRIISEVWANEVEKRAAGYRACQGPYACRIDSDEIMFFDEKELERFFRRGSAVGQIEMPTYIAPGWVKIQPPSLLRGKRARLRAFFRGPRPPLKRYSFLFDRNHVEPEVHLNYLSLVRDVDKRPRAGVMPFDIYPRPIGFGAHLTIWRSIPTSVYRVESYVLHYILRHGVPWLPQLQGRPVEDLNSFFEIVPPQIFREIMLASRLGISSMMAGEIAMAPTPLTPKQESFFAGYYGSLLASHAKLNRQMAEAGLHFTPDMPVVIDISDVDCTKAIAPDGVALIEFEHDVLGVTERIRSLVSHPPWQIETMLEPRWKGRLLAIPVPPLEQDRNATVRREIELSIRTKSGAAVQRFKILLARPLSSELQQI
jgi:hypothetical protein